jgi:hypothetical protein
MVRHVRVLNSLFLRKTDLGLKLSNRVNSSSLATSSCVASVATRQWWTATTCSLAQRSWWAELIEWTPEIGKCKNCARELTNVRRFPFPFSPFLTELEPSSPHRTNPLRRTVLQLTARGAGRREMRRGRIGIKGGSVMRCGAMRLCVYCFSFLPYAKSVLILPFFSGTDRHRTGVGRLSRTVRLSRFASGATLSTFACLARSPLLYLRY